MTTPPEDFDTQLPARRRAAWIYDAPRRWWRDSRPLRRRSGAAHLAVAPTLPERDLVRVRSVVANLLGRHHPSTQRDEVGAIAEAYLGLNDDGRTSFLRMLAHEFWTDAAAVDAAAAALDPAPTGRRAAEQALREALTPAATHLLHLFTGLESGVKFLVDLRADLLRLRDRDPELSDLDVELKAHLVTLFDVGLLSLRRITWDEPASLLEKLIAYEAVHAIDSWADLKNRLDSDRRCYAFLHPAMPEEPLVFVEIALTRGLADNLPDLLDEDAPDLSPTDADTAIFYSISNCQPGLAGVNLGNALIKQVVEQLRVDLPDLDTFATLSPIPGFGRWLEAELRGGQLRDAERYLLPAAPQRVLERLADANWASDDSVEPALRALCARYLTTGLADRAIDPVANFHLANGAAIEQINWMADPSEMGRRSSAGLMATYRYEPEHIAERAEAYASRGEIAMSHFVRDLLKD
ncbi:MAG: malonyl-CoA decarboxylase [Actinomycetia bacterium]|nr:malonyl-CoA decarboxylase [Actinomycetes bacterium]